MSAHIPMTVLLARQLLALARDASYAVVDQSRIRLLKHEDFVLADYFIGRYGLDSVILTRDGVGVSHERVISEAAYARLWLGPVNESSEATSSGDVDDLLTFMDKASEEAGSPADAPSSPPAVSRPRTSSRTWRVCDPALAKDRLKTCLKKHAERERVLKALSEQSIRILPGVTQRLIDRVSALSDDYPNFEPVVKILCRHLHLLKLTRAPLGLPTLLLSGPPGIGKSQFTKALAKVLGLSFLFQSLADTTASFVFTGQSYGWSDPAVGLVAKGIADLGPDQGLLIMVDELDKGHRDCNHPPDRALLGLLEPGTAAHFKDECLDLAIDARPVSWLLTCNEPSLVRAEILSRTRLVEIAAPSLG
ncbi:MAG: AAA family ATPase, partial [Candidatus Dormibacteraceae bacterium]